MLAETSPLIGWAYRAAETQALVAAIAGEPVVPVPYAPEEFIATRLEEPGDVHDWHWDDYAYALVWVLRAPPEAAGGSVELVRNVGWDKAAPRVAEHLRRSRSNGFIPGGNRVFAARERDDAPCDTLAGPRGPRHLVFLVRRPGIWPRDQPRNDRGPLVRLIAVAVLVAALVPSAACARWTRPFRARAPMRSTRRRPASSPTAGGSRPTT